MNLSELTARIQISTAKVALVVTMFRGNVGDIRFINSNGVEFITIRTKSAALKREVQSRKAPRINSIHSIVSLNSDNPDVIRLGAILAEVTDVPVVKSDGIMPLGSDYSNMGSIVLDAPKSGSVIWTHYHSADGMEIGPRISVKSIQ
ncbi:MAG: hypothetical protein GF411_17390 [Candidatus Lokiarchaeota archaeon]|nr:hypothetical protein [Candidatus Lokiarchaeota archaeon]